LTESVASIDATLKDLLSASTATADSLQLIDDEIKLVRLAAFPVERGRPRNLAAWPWAPGTLAQGFLGGRWNRRDGDVYATPVLRGVLASTYPVRGGDDAQSQVDVPSGARRTQ
jgi:hypothetical protein